MSVVLRLLSFSPNQKSSIVSVSSTSTHVQQLELFHFPRGKWYGFYTRAELQMVRSSQPHRHDASRRRIRPSTKLTRNRKNESIINQSHHDRPTRHWSSFALKSCRNRVSKNVQCFIHSEMLSSGGENCVLVLAKSLKAL